MKILGLTGGIATGKSTVSAMLRRRGIPVHDADAVVHGLLERGGAAVSRIAEAFANVVCDGRVDRQALGQKVFSQPQALACLEAILHPLVHRAEAAFLRRCARRRVPMVVLDVPLLLETGGEKRCDSVLLVGCRRFLQEQRALRRPGMTKEKLSAILRRQMSDHDKRRRATWWVPSGLGRAVTYRAVANVVRRMDGIPARHWPPHPRGLQHRKEKRDA